jgi:uncharacterized protein YqhQ
VLLLEKFVIKKNKEKNIKEKNLAYGGQALIEGVLMRGGESYALTIKTPENTFYKEKNNYVSIGKRIKFLGFPFIRGVVGFIENMSIGLKVINKSAEIAFPEENNKKSSGIAMFFVFALSILIALTIFGGLPYYLTSILFPLNHNNNPVSYNLVSGIIRLIAFFLYIFAISFMNDTKRLFGYHGAEHKVINTYEKKEDLTVENSMKSSRLHPRCGTSFIFIVFLISILIFPLFNIYFNTQSWYIEIGKIKNFGVFLQKLVHFLSHIIIGLPIVSSLSYELLKISDKFKKSFIVKVLISPGLFFQLFTTKEPDETMIKASILSLKMVLNEEDAGVKREVSDKIFSGKSNLALNILLIPVFFIFII